MRRRSSGANPTIITRSRQARHSRNEFMTAEVIFSVNFLAPSPLSDTQTKSMNGTRKCRSTRRRNDPYQSNPFYFTGQPRRSKYPPGNAVRDGIGV
jgi:hypothetical protein